MPKPPSAFSATLAGFFDRYGSRPPTLPGDLRADGEAILVTGASRGLGLAITRQLAERGAAVVMACRSRQEEAPAEVRAAVPDAKLSVQPVDLARPAQVEAMLDRLNGPLDRVVLNAGVVPAASRQTDVGLDIMVHVNFVANVQLVAGLRSRGLLAAGARIVVIGSEAHRTAPPIDPETWMVPTNYPTSGVLAVYGTSKRLLHTWAEGLAARAPEVGVVHLCPGAIASDIAREAPAALAFLVKPMMRLMFPSPDRAARSVVWATLTPTLDGRSGVYLHLGQEKDPGGGVRDVATIDALWGSAHAAVARLRGA